MNVSEVFPLQGRADIRVVSKSCAVCTSNKPFYGRKGLQRGGGVIQDTVAESPHHQSASSMQLKACFARPADIIVPLQQRCLDNNRGQPMISDHLQHCVER
jgi:hypothetical protein